MRTTRKLKKALQRKSLVSEMKQKDLEISKELESNTDVFAKKWDDGKPWDKRRTMDEQAYLQQLANESETTSRKKD